MIPSESLLAECAIVGFVPTRDAERARRFYVWTTPDGSKVAWFHDPDANVLSLSQH